MGKNTHIELIGTIDIFADVSKSCKLVGQVS